MACRRGSTFDWPKEATTALIKIYEQYPCLYLPTQQDYHNRSVRNQALSEIAIEFNRRKQSSITPEDVRKKIHGVRTQYMAELSKLKKSEASRASTGELYKTKLWCFDLLQFLQQGSAAVGQGVTNKPVSTTAKREVENSEAFQDDEKIKYEVVYDEDPDHVHEGDLEMFDPSSATEAGWSIASSTSPSSSDGELPQNKQKTKNGEKDKISDLLDTAVGPTSGTLVPEPRQELPQTRRHTLFGQFLADEMETFDDEDILDELKQDLLQTVFSAKKRQREKHQKRP